MWCGLKSVGFSIDFRFLTFPTPPNSPSPFSMLFIPVSLDNLIPVPDLWLCDQQSLTDVYVVLKVYSRYSFLSFFFCFLALQGVISPDLIGFVPFPLSRSIMICPSTSSCRRKTGFPTTNEVLEFVVTRHIADECSAMEGSNRNELTFLRISPI